MANELIPRLRQLRSNLINLLEKTPNAVHEDIEAEEEFDSNTSEDITVDCENLMELIEQKECWVLERKSEVLMRFARKINLLKQMRFPEDREVDDYLVKFMDAADGMDGLLPNLKMDIETLAKYMRRVASSITNMHNCLRSKKATKKKHASMQMLSDCYKLGRKKYGKLDDALSKIQDFLNTAKEQQAETVCVIESAIAYVTGIEDCMFDDESYIDDYVEAYLQPNETIHNILVESLEEDYFDNKRSSCYHGLMIFKRQNMELETKLTKIYDFILSFRGDFWFFETMALPKSMEHLYTYDMQLHSIEKKVQKIRFA